MSDSTRMEALVQLRMIGFATLVLAFTSCSPEDEGPRCALEDSQRCLVNQQGCVPGDDGAGTCVPCEPGTRANGEGRCARIPGTALRHDFDEVVSEPGQEVLGMCRSWTLDNDEELWVNAVELEQDEASHHSNWTFVPETSFPGPDGIWPCEERSYHQLTAALAGGVLYAQSTQARREVQLFPEGAAIRIPPRARIISDVHTLNTTSETVRGHARLSIYTIPRRDVSIVLTPFHIDYHALAIPPRATSRFVTTCELERDFAAAERPFRVRLFYSLPHTHELGSRVFLQAVGGPHDGEMLLDVRGFNGEARGVFYEPPLDLEGVTALRFGCEFQNPRAETVGWGFDDQEMCEMLGFIESPAAFESRVETTTSMRMDGDVQEFSGECGSFVIPWER